MRLIDKDEFEDILEEMYYKTTVLINKIDKAPAIDAVPVIRCKDCKYKNEHGYCTVYMSFHRLTADMDYCSEAERKDKDNE